MIFHDNGDIDINVNTVQEAKLAIKQLKLKRKDHANVRKEIAIAHLNAARRQQLANRGRVMRGGGGIGQTIRAFQAISRDSDKRKHAADLAPLEARKATADRLIHTIDRAVTTLEGYILQQEVSA